MNFSAPSTLPTSAFPSNCAFITPFSGSVSPLSPEFLSLLLVSLPKSKDEVPASGVSW